MKFYVRFKSADGGWPVEKPDRAVGLRLLDQARREFGEVLPQDMDAVILRLVDEPRIEITEEQARTAGVVFEDLNEVVVTVPEQSLNIYVDIKLIRENDRVYAVHRLNAEAIVHDWLVALAPLVWDAGGGSCS